MTHLTDDQLEELLLAGQSDSEHLAACPQCRARWEEQCALRRRLHAAWSGIHAPGELAERLRRQIADASGAPHRASAFHWPPRFRWLAVAAVLLIGSALVIHYGTGSFENVAQAQLVEFHQANLSPSAGIYGSADPAKLATYMRSKLGYVPQVPQPVAGISIRGGCVRKFCCKTVGSYLLQTPNGPVSIIVINDHPQTLGLQKQTGCAMCKNCQCWAKSLKEANMAAVRRGGYSYYAVGDLPQEKLGAVLMAIYPPDTPLKP